MKRLRKVMVLLLAFSFLGQAVVTSAVPCPTMAGKASAEHASMNPAHAGHHAVEAATDDSAPVDCCKGGLCAMSHCHLVPGALQTSVITGLVYAYAYPVTADFSSPIHPASFLYRPPISR